jgi:hypothetical protein
MARVANPQLRKNFSNSSDDFESSMGIPPKVMIDKDESELYE